MIHTVLKYFKSKSGGYSVPKRTYRKWGLKLSFYNRGGCLINLQAYEAICTLCFLLKYPWAKTTWTTLILIGTMNNIIDYNSYCGSYLQLCTGIDETAVGACFQLVFAPIDELFPDDAPLLPSGFRVIPLDSKSVEYINTNTPARAHTKALMYAHTILALSQRSSFSNRFSHTSLIFLIYLADYALIWHIIETDIILPGDPYLQFSLGNGALTLILSWIWVPMA